jgi:anti-sigma factor RsiW
MSHCDELREEILEVALGATPSETLRSHLETCIACKTELARQRALAQQMDEAVYNVVRATPPEKMFDSVMARALSSEPRMRRSPWVGVAAGATAIAASLIVLFGLRAFQPHTSPVTSDVALTSWHSPTAALLRPHGSVLFTPLRDPRFDIESTPSHTKHSLGETHGT